MTDFPGASGLVLNEPLLWEKGQPGRVAVSLPEPDVAPAALPAELAGEGPDFPDLSEMEVVRHYTRLSTWISAWTPACTPWGPAP
jgi:glycine dehydrogenase subunit 2